METEIKNIEVIGNPRTEFGSEGITELTSSIKQHGILQPLVVVEITDRKGKFELISGERRLRAATLLGFKEVPIFPVPGGDKELLQLTENLQREDLSPIEEGVAFSGLMKKGNMQAEKLAKLLGKSTNYVKRRLEIMNCNKKVLEELKKNKIQLGHALALSRLEKKDQLSILEEIKGEQLSVGGTISNIRYGESKELRHAPFDLAGCKGCKFNGGEQTILYDTGSDLNGICMKASCFIKKTLDYLKAKAEEYKKKEVKTFTNTDKLQEEYPKAQRLWGTDKDKALKDIKKHPEKYAISVEYDYEVEEKVFSIVKEKTTPTKKPSGSSALQLENKITDHMRAFSIRKTRERLKLPENKLNNMMVRLYFLVQDCTSDQQKVICKDVGTKYNYGLPENFLAKLMKLPEAEIEEMLAHQAVIRTKKLWAGNLELMTKASGVDVKKEFKVTETFLKLHTIEQLKELAKEQKVDLGNSKKKTEIVSVILKDWPKGKAPKAVMKRVKK